MRILGKMLITGICLTALLCCVPAALAAGHTADCPHCDETVTWTAWDGTTNLTKAGHYYLPEGVAAMTATRKIGTNDADRFDVVLDLNGQELTISKSTKMFQVVNGDTLVLFDSSKEQTGGLTGRGVATSHAGIIQAYGGSVEIYSGTYRLADGYQATKDGGLIFASYNAGQYPVITVHGGTFYGATGAENGAVIAGNNSTVNIYGGTIHAGKASSAGDTIYMKNEWAQLHISGDPVIEGGIFIGSGVVWDTTIQGKPIIQGTDGGSNCGIKLSEGKLIKLGTLEEGAKIGITGTGVVVRGIADPLTAQKLAKDVFVADAAGKVIKTSGSNLVVTTDSAQTTFDCPHCDETVTWTAWDGAAALAAGHYYLEKDTQMTVSGTLEFSENTTVVLNLNGHTLSKPEAGRMFLLQSKAKLVVMDSSANATGTMIGNSVNNHGMLIMTFADDASAEICGGNFFVQNPELKTKSGALVYASKGIVKVTGGEFFGAAAEKGGVVATAAAGTLEITGGTFHAGTADKGDTMYVASESTVTIGGTAQFDGGVEINTEADVTISGTPVIYKLTDGSAYSLITRTPVTLGVLAEGAKIAVTSAPDQTVFTAELADEAAAKAALTFFSSDDNNKLIKAEGKALSCVACEAAPADSEDKAQLNAHYIGTTAYHGEMHDHSNSGGKSDGDGTLDLWKAQMAELGMDFAVIADHKQASHMRLDLWDNTIFVGGSEAQTKLTTLPEGMGTMHFNMIFSQPEKLENVLYQFYNYNGVEFAYINFSRTEMEALVKAVKANGGMFVHVHPKASKYIKSDDPLDYWYGNDTGLEVLYAYDRRDMNSAVNRENYKLWTDLLALGKRVWATAGRDQHRAPSVDALSTVYAEQKHADSFLEHMRVGDFTAGPMGIRMSIGDVKSGAQTEFKENDRLVLYVGDFHESLDPTHTYRVDLFDDRGEVYHQEISSTGENWFAFDVDTTAKFYRAEVYDVTNQIQIAIGNPIWNSTFQEAEPEEPEPTGETCPHCGLAVEWTAWNGAAPAANSHLYVPEKGVSISSYVRLDKNHVVIDLRGHAITSSVQPFRIAAGADAYIIDSVGGGTVTSKGSSGRHGGIFQFIGAGSLTITGGTYSLSADEVFDESGYNGGLIYMGRVGGTLTITGGAFHPTSAKGGDSIYVTESAPVVTIGGTAVINGGVQFDNAASFTLSGTPTIQKAANGSAYSLKIASGKKLALNGLQPNASIGITAADGVFTAALADENTAATVATFFTADNTAKAVIADGRALTIADKPEEPEITRGDMNGDGEVTDADALYLLRHTLFSDRYPITQSGDVNGDSEVTDADALYLLRFTLFPDRYPLH